MVDDEFDQISRQLYAELEREYREDLEKMMGGELVDIEPGFMGFVDIYKNLAEVINREYTIIDIGCAYAPQAYYFRDHKKYIGVDLSRHHRIPVPNAEYYFCDAREFVKGYEHVRKEFAICSYVPPWGGDNIQLTKDNFQNVFTFYPSDITSKAFIKLKDEYYKRSKTISKG